MMIVQLTHLQQPCSHFSGHMSGDGERGRERLGPAEPLQDAGRPLQLPARPDRLDHHPIRDTPPLEPRLDLRPP